MAVSGSPKPAADRARDRSADFDISNLESRTARMTALTAGTLLVLFLPFLLSLAGQAGTSKVLCFVTSLLAMLLSVREFGAVLPWCLGMAIAVISVREKFRQRRSA
jgi:nicotinamide riboside transporter PnuC